MREFKDAFNQKFDLDDPKTYDYLPKTIDLLEDRVMMSYGYACAYMLRVERCDIFTAQLERVEVFMDGYWKNRLEKHYSKDLMWFKEQAFILEDMTENLC